MGYDFKSVERKWQERWDKNPPAKTRPANSEKKYYCLDMFPYPSGSGLHVGHWRGYVLSDVYARIKWLEGYNVLHPMGWDAFGLPAENDAIKKGIHPKENTAKNIEQFRTQLRDIAAIYDWDKEVNTTDPNYYKWTQWIFLQLFKEGLAYEAETAINWCTSCLTGLANEEVVNGACERCGARVEQRKIRQWMLKITYYAQKLLDGLDTLDWHDKIKTMQRNWIGRSEGLQIQYEVVDVDGKTINVETYTTCPETMFGVTFLVIAPDHPLVDRIVRSEQREEADAYRAHVKTISPFERKIEKEKTGVFTGSYARNPANDDQVPIYLASYVLLDYGTGIVQGVPAHDERDFEFANVFDLERPQVVDGSNVCVDDNGDMCEAYGGDGLLMNSGPFNGLPARTEARQKIADFLVEKGVATRQVQYKIRDWIFSRQRYWGEPIPLIHCKACGVVPVPEDQLPVELPNIEKYQPTGTGESPLANVPEWVNTTCPACNGSAKRETNTMPQWAGSCWYFLRYPNPNLDDKAWDMKDMNYWMPVDLYVGGIEHAILHLLYARFWIKVLYDLGYVPFDEPFSRLFNQGMILRYSAASGQVEKMSKSKGNTVNPDEMVVKYGSDVLRMYVLFMGPPDLDCEWQDAGLEGVKRFANRFWNYLIDANTLLPDDEHEDEVVSKRLHKFLKQFQERIDYFKPNTALSALMEWLNDASAQNMQLSKASIEKVLAVYSIMSPHMASELLEHLCGKQLDECPWPHYDPVLTYEDRVTIVVQVNGKMRASLQVQRGAEQEDVEPEAEKMVLKWLKDKEPIKVIFVQDRLINFVV